MADDVRYTATEDYYEELQDGGRKKVLSAGQQVSWDTAYALGLVTTKHPPKGLSDGPKLRPIKAEKQDAAPDQ